MSPKCPFSAQPFFPSLPTFFHSILLFGILNPSFMSSISKYTYFIDSFRFLPMMDCFPPCFVIFESKLIISRVEQMQAHGYRSQETFLFSVYSTSNTTLSLPSLSLFIFLSVSGTWGFPVLSFFCSPVTLSTYSSRVFWL